MVLLAYLVPWPWPFPLFGPHLYFSPFLLLLHPTGFDFLSPVRNYLLVMELHAHALLEMLPLGLREDPG
jgi:hypothetical protein